MFARYRRVRAPASPSALVSAARPHPVAALYPNLSPDPDLSSDPSSSPVSVTRPCSAAVSSAAADSAVVPAAGAAAVAAADDDDTRESRTPSELPSDRRHPDRTVSYE